jgi:hypothetical protein
LITNMASATSRRSWYARIRLRTEICRYFPDWADRPVTAGTYREADRNSYAAGGYAEEFGYGAHRDWRAAPALIEDPEGCDRWHIYIDGLHPGYPECPRPCDRVSDPSRDDGATGAGIDARQRGVRVIHSLPQPRGRFATIRAGGASPHLAREPIATLLSKWNQLRIRRRQFGLFS